MNNQVCLDLEILFQSLNMSTLRYNMRGKTSWTSKPEVQDLEQIIQKWEFKGKIILCGYSYGSVVSLQAKHPRIHYQIAVGFPSIFYSLFTFSFFSLPSVPVFFISGKQDYFITNRFVKKYKVLLVEGNHFQMEISKIKEWIYQMKL